MPIVTRRQSTAVMPEFDPALKTPMAASRRQTMGHHALKQKDSNIIVELAAPIQAPFQSPFKSTRKNKLSALSSKVAALAASVSAAVGGEDKENQQQQQEQDESDRAWEELNKPNLIAVVEATPSKRSGLRHSIVPEEFSSDLNDVAPTPFKPVALTPGPSRRRRSSTRGSALKGDAPIEDDFGSGHIGDAFEEEESSDRVTMVPHSFTPSSYGRTRSALTPNVQSKKADRRSLHHTQLQLLKQIVQDEEQLVEACKEDVTEENKEDSEPVAVVPTPAKAATARKSRQSIAPATAPRASQAPRKSLFEAAPLVFHGVTPPATPLTPAAKKNNKTVLSSVETIPLPAAPATPAPLPEAVARAITPRSNSRRKSFQQREEEQQQEVFVVEEPSVELADELEAPVSIFAPAMTVEEHEEGEVVILGEYQQPEDAAATELEEEQYIEMRDEEEMVVNEIEYDVEQEIIRAPQSTPAAKRASSRVNTPAKQVQHTPAKQVQASPVKVQPTPAQTPSKQTPAKKKTPAKSAKKVVEPVDVTPEEIVVPKSHKKRSAAALVEEIIAASIKEIEPAAVVTDNSVAPVEVIAAAVPSPKATPLTKGKGKRQSKGKTPSKQVIEVVAEPGEVAVIETIEEPVVEEAEQSVIVSMVSAKKPTPVARASLSPESAQQSQGNNKKRSKRSLVGMIAREYTSSAAADIPDDILAQLFVRPSKSSEELKEIEQQAEEEFHSKQAAKRAQKEHAKESEVAHTDEEAVEKQLEEVEIQEEEEETVIVAVKQPSPAKVATPVPTPRTRASMKEEQAAAAGPRTPATSRRSVIPPTPSTPYVAPVRTKLTPTAMVEQMQHPHQMIAYGAVFIIALGIMVYWF